MERDTRRRRGEPDRYPPRRRKNKRSPVSSSMMYIVLVCAVSVVLAAVCWSLGNDVLALNKENTSATITVNDENDFGSVADQLKGNDIIKHKGLFKLFASLTGGKDKIAQGTYEVNSDMDYRALLNSMSSNSASRKDISVTITEGQTLKQIFELLEKEGVEWATAAQAFCRLLETERPTLLCAYNAQFDLNFLYYLLKPLGLVSVLRKPRFLDALTVYRDRRDYPHKLCNAIEAYGLTEAENSHRAVDDARATVLLLEAMAAERDDLDRYVDLFGYSPKYGVSGRRIASVEYRPQPYQRVRPLYEVTETL